MRIRKQGEHESMSIFWFVFHMAQNFELDHLAQE